jgi:hypothetical protein
MLKGGVGCIRLRPKTLDIGSAWFLSASSTGVAHEGFPVAIPDDIFQGYIDSVKRRGALRCTLQGKLQFLPDPVVELYRDYRGVPQLYLLVEKLIPDSDQGHEQLLVSAGISFLSTFEGKEKMYASYATFDSGVPGSVDEVVDWIQDVYVKELYGGRVITDFDEQMTHFENATFSLRNIMNNRLNRDEVQTVIQTLNLYAADTAQLFTGLTSIDTVRVERSGRINIAEKITMSTTTTTIGTITGSNVNIASTLTNVTEAIGGLCTADQSTKDELTKLVTQLNDDLQKLSTEKPDRKDQVEAVAVATSELVEKAKQDKPNRTLLQHAVDGVKSIAETLEDVAPAVLNTVTRISGIIAKLNGS